MYICALVSIKGALINMSKHVMSKGSTSPVASVLQSEWLDHAAAECLFDMSIPLERDLSFNPADSMRGRFQVIGNLKEQWREGASSWIAPSNKKEMEGMAAFPQRPIIDHTVKEENSLHAMYFPQTRLIRPYVEACLDFERAHNPRFRTATVRLNVKQWSFTGDHGLAYADEGGMHVDPPLEGRKGERLYQNSYVISDNNTTLIAGEEKHIIKPFDVVALNSNCWHQQRAFSASDCPGKSRLMAHLSVFEFAQS